MTTRLSRDECLDLIKDLDLDEGEQINTFHCKDGKGNDKLYIKRNSDGYLFYCHHCSQRGFVSVRSLSPRGSSFRPASAGASPVNRDGSGTCLPVSGGEGRIREKLQIYLPRDAVNGIKRWPSVDAKVWILKHGLTISDVDAAGICWSDSLSSIIFPRYCEGELVSFQTRKFPAGDGPKYLTYGDSKAVYDAFKGPSEALGDAKRVVLVEDMLSALKVAQIASAFVLGGTAIKDDQLRHLLKSFNKFDIMLDNDNWQVKTNQYKLYKKLSLFSRDVRVIEVDKDPKEYSLDELKELLK